MNMSNCSEKRFYTVLDGDVGRDGSVATKWDRENEEAVELQQEQTAESGSISTKVTAQSGESHTDVTQMTFSSQLLIFRLKMYNYCYFIYVYFSLIQHFLHSDWLPSSFSLPLLS